MQGKSLFPESLVLIFAMILAAQLLGYMLPPGEFEREGRRVIPGTFHPVQAQPLPWHSFLTKIPKGLEEGAEIIFFVFIVGGVIGVVRATGAIDALIGTAIRHAGGNPLLLVGGMLTLFAVGSSTIGMAEEYMPFIPVLVTMCIALRMDAMVAVGIVYLGAGIGYGCAALNPFTVQIAQQISDLTPTSGQGFRWLLLLVMLVVAIHHLMRYVRQVQADPSRSLVGDVDYSRGFTMPEDTRMTAPRLSILLLFALGIGLFAYGASEASGWGWFLVELAAIFMGIALVAAVLGRISPNAVATRFCSGAAELTTTALLIGFARTIEVMLVDARIIDSVIHGIAGQLDGLGPIGAVWGMLLVQSFCNFLIPSGSGQAFVTMPIMAPLSDLVGITRQTAVLAYQFGDGFTNMIVPTNALLMGMLALGKIPYQRWLRFVVPFLVKVYVIACIALAIAVWIEY
jgi:uncharacterized ion transporter superfamily protein YfcC